MYSKVEEVGFLVVELDVLFSPFPGRQSIPADRDISSDLFLPTIGRIRCLFSIFDKSILYASSSRHSMLFFRDFLLLMKIE